MVDHLHLVTTRPLMKFKRCKEYSKKEFTTNYVGGRCVLEFGHKGRHEAKIRW
jgi:hypothetical protein